MDYIKTLSNKNKILSVSGLRNTQQQSPDFNIRFVFSGVESCKIGWRHLSIHPDSFLILNSGTECSTIGDPYNPYKSFSLFYDQDFLIDFITSWTFSDDKLLDNPFYSSCYPEKLNETIYPFNGDMKYNIQHLRQQLDGGLCDELLINDYMYHCLLLYFRIYNHEILRKSEKLKFLQPRTRNEILRRLNLAKEYLSSNYNTNISLEDLGKHACLSVNHLLRTFKQAFDISPHQYLTRLRLQRAQSLLINTDHPISEVVSLVGFECCSSFGRLFKTTYNVSPMRYRKNMAS